MSEQIFKERCPKCDSVNFVSGGDPNDLTGFDVPAGPAGRFVPKSPGAQP